MPLIHTTVLSWLLSLLSVLLYAVLCLTNIEAYKTLRHSKEEKGAGHPPRHELPSLRFTSQCTTCTAYGATVRNLETLKRCSAQVLACLQLCSAGFIKPEDLPIKYPGPTKPPGDSHNDAVADECRNQTFCTVKPPDYPQEQFDKMFKGSKLGNLPNLVIANDSSLLDFPNRQGGPGDEDDCRTTVTFEPLFQVRSKRGDWRTVVQSEQQNYVQKVRLETCVKPNSKCFTRFGEIPGIETYCRQNYNDWEIVVSDGKGGTETVTTSLPVCCSCHYRSVDLASRFGKPKNGKQ